MTFLDRSRLLAAGAVLALAGCGGGHGEGDTTAASASATRSEHTAAADVAADPAPLQMTPFDAVRLANQATFGPTEALVAEMQSLGAPSWISAQMALNVSRYTSGRGSAIHRNLTNVEFCDQPQWAGPNCWRDWFSAVPLVWDFYRNATTQPDQLRQRVALALQQILVVSNVDVDGTYGFRRYHNMLLDHAFGNYRDVLRSVALSPLMGEYLDNVNNDRRAPNENFARELMQLFTIGTCRLNPNGTLRGDTCTPTYDNRIVRQYAQALTGWTFPLGGSYAEGPCWPEGANCQFHGGDMVPAPAFRDRLERRLLSDVVVPANTDAPAALELVLDSLMAHPNVAPFMARHFIQHLVASNPRPAYVQRVATAFIDGRYTAGEQVYGTGQRGDLAATIAAVLLDEDARGDRYRPDASGKLREPVLMFTGVLRALNGHTDGNNLAWSWGEALHQHIFRPPSVFNFYAPDFPVAGTALTGPQFGIHSADTGLARLNFVTALVDYGGFAADPNVPRSIGTRVDLTAFLPDAADPARLVDRLSMLALGRRLARPARDDVIAAVRAWNENSDPAQWPMTRVQTAAVLIFSSPDYQVHQ